MNFKQEYSGHWTEEENSFFKIQHRIAVIDYIIGTEEFDADLIRIFGKSNEFRPDVLCASQENARRIKRLISETNDWKTVWEFVQKYQNWSLERLREEKRRWVE